MVGIGLIVIAPLSLVAYRLFDSTVDDRTWYYTSMYWYVHTIGPYLCLLLWSIGSFLLFPVKSTLSYVSMILPASTACSMLYHLTFYAKDYASFNSPVWIVYVVGGAAALALLMCADYMVYRKYHLEDGNLARIDGIIKAPGVPAEMKIQILETLIVERQNFYARV